jgi:5-(carboxyamino)imidazole ribonucleotide mutase
MPKGVPVATVAIGNARNAGLLAVSILALNDGELQKRLEQFKSTMAEQARAMNSSLQR